jgi:uncharacterized Zn-finger protein
MTLPAIPDHAEVMCPWCGAGIPLARFVTSDEEVGADVAVCPGCHRRVTLQLPLTPG